MCRQPMARWWCRDTGADAIVRAREVFALSEDGDTLTIDVTAATPNGETTSRLVYRRVGGIHPYVIADFPHTAPLSYQLES